jgi:molybdate transport system substrate-binding protein
MALAVALAGCGGGRGGGSGGLTVFAAASLSDVLPGLDAEATYNFAGSDDLAEQLRSGVHADVYAAASPKYPEELYTAGIVDKPVVFATNRLVVIVPRGSSVRTLADLERPGTTIAIAAAGVPVGDYTRQALDRAGADAVLRNVVSEEPDVKGVVAKVVSGAADAGFVYATDAKAAADAVSVVELPQSAQPEVRYEVAVVAASKHPDEAAAFVTRLLGSEGRAALRKAGFGVP